jgi:hypothetical protein
VSSLREKRITDRRCFLQLLERPPKLRKVGHLDMNDPPRFDIECDEETGGYGKVGATGTKKRPPASARS